MNKSKVIKVIKSFLETKARTTIEPGNEVYNLLVDIIELEPTKGEFNPGEEIYLRGTQHRTYLAVHLMQNGEYICGISSRLSRAKSLDQFKKYFS